MKHARLITILAILALFALVGTAVFVYLPGDITVGPVNPPIQLAPGSNAGQPDLAGNTIGVTIGANDSSFTLNVNPTYQKTRYHDVVRINNPSPPAGDSYYIAVRVNTPLSGPYSSATLYVIDSTNTVVLTVDLTTTGTSVWSSSPLADGQYFRIDVEFVLPEGSQLPGSSTINIEIIYSPQNTVTPP